MRHSAIIAIFLVSCAYAQTNSQAFESASVKPSPPRDGSARYIARSGGPGTGDPAHLVYRNVAIFNLLQTANNASIFQISGPDWLGRETFDITATVPPGTTKAQFNEMLINLLVARFHLKYHRETRVVSGYELTVGKNGLKLKEAIQSESPDMKMSMTMDPGAKKPAVHLTFLAQRLSGLVNVIGTELSKPVTDKTGLTGLYDFSFDYTFGAANPVADFSSDSAPDVLTAAREQLGLNLVSAKVALEMIVVDSVDKIPTEN